MRTNRVEANRSLIRQYGLRQLAKRGLSILLALSLAAIDSGVSVFALENHEITAAVGDVAQSDPETASGSVESAPAAGTTPATDISPDANAASQTDPQQETSSVNDSAATQSATDGVSFSSSEGNVSGTGSSVWEPQPSPDAATAQTDDTSKPDASEDADETDPASAEDPETDTTDSEGQRTQYAVTFEFYVDDTLFTAVTVSDGDTLTVPDAPEKEDFTFAGWFSKDGKQITSGPVAADDIGGGGFRRSCICPL